MANRMLPLPQDAPFSDAQLDSLRGQLEEQLAFRLDQIAQLDLSQADGPLSSTDPEIHGSLVAGARAALSDVQAALERLRSGEYGWCLVCGELIGTERLEILPQAATCLPCEAARPE
jgi:RNA polymerase-binding transcription factor DksA